MGAEGIGLCRTEHMFLDPLRLPAVRQMLLNSEAAEAWRREHEGSPIDPLANPFMNPEVSDIPSEVVDFYQALERVKRLQTNDFRGILRAMSRRPVIIRLLDAPLHEFLPPYDELLVELATLRGDRCGERRNGRGSGREGSLPAPCRFAAGDEPDAGAPGLSAGAVVPVHLPDAGGGDHHGRSAAGLGRGGSPPGDHGSADGGCGGDAPPAGRSHPRRRRGAGADGRRGALQVRGRWWRRRGPP